MSPVTNPIDTLVESIREAARHQGFSDVRPGAGLAGEDDVLIDMEEAFDYDAMLPILIQRAASIYRDAWLDRTTWKYPFEIVECEEGLLGLAVRWRDGEAPFPIALLCALDALQLLIERNPDPAPVLLME